MWPYCCIQRCGDSYVFKIYFLNIIFTPLLPSYFRKWPAVPDQTLLCCCDRPSSATIPSRCWKTSPSHQTPVYSSMRWMLKAASTRLGSQRTLFWTSGWMPPANTQTRLSRSRSTYSASMKPRQFRSIVSASRSTKFWSHTTSSSDRNQPSFLTLFKTQTLSP